MKTNLKLMTSRTWTKAIALCCMILLGSSAFATPPKLDSMGRKDRFLGFTMSLEQGFSTYKNDTYRETDVQGNVETRKPFSKPSLGGSIVFAYNPVRFLGFQSGFGIMQRGSGILTDDTEKGLGNADSTYRRRIRITTLQIPLNLCWRVNTFHPNMKLSGAIGYIWVYNMRTLDIFHSVEDGFHLELDVKDQYKKSWSEWNLSIGFDFDANKACVFRVHYYVNSSFSSIYDPGTGFTAKSFIQGARFQWYL
jgi:hypothetical protein